ncbi:glucosamine 6-phosphate synthetase [Psychrobacter sp. I-STPA6b]|uniref:glucosamine 6-phosphate synthetase n=1 Tax=Psychrobacter sp. I-STPA6b TaxID=2585718 RepID=UPI001D0C2470|nr:glucosamine 6-phosphate synthetase [Psychrobacter sp. I-STPA6b]
MCGIFGVLDKRGVSKRDLMLLAKHSQQRGRDSSGLITFKSQQYNINRADFNIMRLLGKVDYSSSSIVLGHSRLVTNSMINNQPIIRNDFIVIHNGIIVNDEEIWKETLEPKNLQIDTEVIAVIAEQYYHKNGTIVGLSESVLSKCKGVVACAVMMPKLGKLVLFSNNGSLYIAKNKQKFCFASEKYVLEKLGFANIEQVINREVILDIPITEKISIDLDILDKNKKNLVPTYIHLDSQEQKLLEYNIPNLKRCTKCILPETMPYITFNEQGVCNYCTNYKIRNEPKPKNQLLTLLQSYRRTEGAECIVPFSGGRDSCYGLHLVVKELNLKPIAYTYDWGMVTDLGRRNISRMCAQLGVENIVVAANIAKKRKNIARNLAAWLKAPNLGMVSILTAGDKHFFRHIETVKKQTNVSLNLWGINPLEVTHFKAGFLGVPPDFDEKRVYMHGWQKQVEYQKLRFLAMTKSIGYFNDSLLDTLTGEYYRSFTKKKDYYHIFDYWRWDESLIDDLLINEYDWETAVDTSTTWRIGDGTSGFYNYIYYTVAGFTEHDTFRSNQIREGQISREKALSLVLEENQPRYQNIRWYLDVIGMDFRSTINTINQIPKIYEMN